MSSGKNDFQNFALCRHYDRENYVWLGQAAKVGSAKSARDANQEWLVFGLECSFWRCFWEITFKGLPTENAREFLAAISSEVEWMNVVWTYSIHSTTCVQRDVSSYLAPPAFSKKNDHLLNDAGSEASPFCCSCLQCRACIDSWPGLSAHACPNKIPMVARSCKKPSVFSKSEPSSHPSLEPGSSSWYSRFLPDLFIPARLRIAFLLRNRMSWQGNYTPLSWHCSSLVDSQAREMRVLSI